MGGMTTLCWAFTVNALLDDSPPDFQAAQIQGLVTVTHSFIFREYKIEYRLLGPDQEKHDLLSTPEHMKQFKTGLAVAEVHAGWFGWRWVKDIKPVQIDQVRGKE